MICVSLAEKSTAELLAVLPEYPFAEIRLDAVDDLSEKMIKKIFAGHPRLIATHRPGRISEPERIDLLAAAVSAGAAYVDIEIETNPAGIQKVVAAARAHNRRVIVSFHDESGTPSRDVLEDIRRRGFAAGADLVKIACLSRGPADNARLLGLLDDPRPTVVIGMGVAGRITRLVAPLLGSPFTYASPSAGKETAAGQLDADFIRRSWEAWKDV
ncbi:MAG: type I 3-dehydroquinate dehydratase [Candidatus Aminicenantes bacterium]|nr:type I 3-dehydroquinate dehydratase [Candidatus Aminicenantes bacterium]